MTSGGSGRSQMATAVAVALAILSGGGVTSAEAAGLGRLTVQSALGQPLRAEVEVTSVSPDEAESLKARIASPEAFSRVGLQYKEALSGVRMDVENRGGRYFIKVTSSRPINDPFVDLVVELSWASGTFSREYTFLLDPPTQQNANQANRSGNAPVAGAATAAAATGAAASGSNAVRTIDPATGRLVNQERGAQGRSQAASQPTEAKQQPAAQAKAGRDASSEGGTVTVGQGETLGMIAARVRPASATLDQTIVAIYRTNPTAFIQNNPNLLRQGRTLTIPSEGEIAAIDSTEAGRQLRMAARDFRSYKERMAGTTPEVATGNGSSTASGAISAKVDDERGGQAGSQDRLELSRSEGGKDEQGSAVGARDAEAQVAREAALKEANSRIAELEKNVGALKSMLELKDKSLADLQAQLEKARVAGAQVSGTVAAAATAAADKARDAASKVADKAAAEKTAAEKAVAEKAAQTKAAADKLAAEAKAAADKVAAEKAAAEKAAADKAAAEKAAAEKAAADKAAADKAAADKAAAEKAAADKAAAEQDQSKPAEGADKDAVERAAADAKAEVERVTNGDADKSKDMPKPAPVNESEEQGGLIEGLSQNSLLLPGLGVAALAAGLGFWMLRRRRREDDGFSDSISADEFSANSLFGTTGGQSVDTMTGASTQITTISESTPTEVDPIAEAEVYIAYGRETQAEEILREALKRQPERQAIRLKLLEIYSGRKDTVAFGQMAREMHDMTGGLNEEWSKVVQMGAALDPDNALYGDGTADLAAPSPVASPAADVGGMAAAGAAAVAAGVAGVAAAVEPEAQAVSSPSLDEGLAFDGGYNKPAAEAESKPVQTFQSTRSGPLSAMPGVELPSLDLDAPLDLDEGPSTVTDLNIDTTITESLDMGHASGGEGDGLGAIGLDLSPSTISGPITMSGAASSQWQEMASKLDLASAYVEIGDKEGARELLEEVINGGDAAQQQRARELLADL
ncbi:FimV/HubP family polar landmark protein [Lautropia mirabilis ATCC 51599]|uniref:FimV domain protein n=2 Tax=Lautropia mirabilis TaxID=47671 RepID=E7RWN6_9BURK|nr:FimV/HubP family polar landmark protein [Lautropia mirabilis]EFV95140.1 FimV domain protein [Lautropia mirabilis ATCC 51599]